MSEAISVARRLKRTPTCYVDAGNAPVIHVAVTRGSAPFISPLASARLPQPSHSQPPALHVRSVAASSLCLRTPASACSHHHQHPSAPANMAAAAAITMRSSSRSAAAVSSATRATSSTRLMMSRRPAVRVQAHYQVTMHSPSGCRKFEVAADETLLQGALAAGVEVPNLCGTGACGNCASRLVAGEVERTDFLLDDEQKAAGFVLLCTSHPLSDVEVRSHQETEMHTIPYGL